MQLDQGPFEALQAALGYRFAKIERLERALTHRSVLGRRPKKGHARAMSSPMSAQSNERLEFIGDRVLGLTMAEWLLERFPSEAEGALGPRHAALVSRDALVPIAERIGIPAALLVAEHEDRAGIRTLANVVADALEAVLGAIYLEAGLAPVRRVIRRLWADMMVSQVDPPKDPKTALQEWLLGRGHELPTYEVQQAVGPSHAPQFTISVTSLSCEGVGVAGSKRAAESMAARNLLNLLVRKAPSAGEQE